LRRVSDARPGREHNPRRRSPRFRHSSMARPKSVGAAGTCMVSRRKRAPRNSIREIVLQKARSETGAEKQPRKTAVSAVERNEGARLYPQHAEADENTRATRRHRHDASDSDRDTQRHRLAAAPLAANHSLALRKRRQSEVNLLTASPALSQVPISAGRLETGATRLANFPRTCLTHGLSGLTANWLRPGSDHFALPCRERCLRRRGETPA
jgi:hypothetical protein